MNHRDFFDKTAPSLPLTPGCYMFLDKEGNVLYVGKSKCLKKRVASYFGIAKFKKFNVMLRFADSIAIEETGTDIEALLLEHKLIKKYRPQYNAKMRRDYQYWYIKLDGSILVTLNTDSAGFFVGPFSHKETAMEALEILGKCFKLPTCNKIADQVTRMCLRGHMNNCFAPCENKESGTENYQNALSFLQGSHKETLAGIQKKMQSAIESMEFEKAADFKTRYEELAQLLVHTANRSPILAKKRFVVFLKSRHEECFMLVYLDDGQCLAKVLVSGLLDTDKIRGFAKAIVSKASFQRQNPKPANGLFNTCEENKAFLSALVEISAIRRFLEIETEFTCALALEKFIKEMIQ